MRKFFKNYARRFAEFFKVWSLNVEMHLQCEFQTPP